MIVQAAGAAVGADGDDDGWFVRGAPALEKSGSVARGTDDMPCDGNLQARPPRLSLPSVSFCIPTRNGGGYVGEALASVLRQTFDDYELLVVDDASTDRTLDVVGSFADPRVTLHRNRSPLGIPSNWNECLRRARGQYVKFLFQDDTLVPDALERLVAALERCPEAAMAFGRRELPSAPGLEILGEAYTDWLQRFYASVGPTVRGSDLVEAALLQGRDLTLNVVGEPSFVLLRREAALKSGGFDSTFRQLADWELWLRLARRTPLAFVNESLGQFRVHAESQSAASFRTLRVRRELLRFLAHVGRLYAADLSPRARRRLRQRRWRHRFGLAAAVISGAPPG
jgi:glycosyltransferase involved in cell wall biosynthesis